MTTILKPRHVKLLAKLPLKPEPSEPEVRMNRFTGVTHTLEPAAIPLYDFILDSIGITVSGDILPRHVSYNNTVVSIKLWHDARMAFCELWPDQYMDLID